MTWCKLLCLCSTLLSLLWTTTLHPSRNTVTFLSKEKVVKHSFVKDLDSEVYFFGQSEMATRIDPERRNKSVGKISLFLPGQFFWNKGLDSIHEHEVNSGILVLWSGTIGTYCSSIYLETSRFLLLSNYCLFQYM